MRALAPSEIQFLLRVINPRTPFGARDSAMLIFDLHTGLRVSEICGLRVGDVVQWSAPRKVLDLPAHLGKGGHARDIPLNATAREMVSLLMRFNSARGFSLAPEAPLLTNRAGEPLPVRTYQHIVQRYREAAELSPRITPHSFRHTLANNLVLAGVSLRVIQELLGHKRLNTVQVYTHPTLADKGRAMDSVG